MKKKFLCVCQGGSCRSVALAFLFKYKYGQDSLACGWEGNTPETLNMLCEWADGIFILESHFKEKIDEKYHHKLSVYDVGPDRFFQINKELLSILDDMIKNHFKVAPKA
jgi:predicted protein tyrosine phosphatase